MLEAQVQVTPGTDLIAARKELADLVDQGCSLFAYSGPEAVKPFERALKTAIACLSDEKQAWVVSQMNKAVVAFNAEDEKKAQELNDRCLGVILGRLEIPREELLAKSKILRFQ